MVQVVKADYPFSAKEVFATRLRSVSKTIRSSWNASMT